jgi:hypothetical protein
MFRIPKFVPPELVFDFKPGLTSGFFLPLSSNGRTPDFGSGDGRFESSGGY